MSKSNLIELTGIWVNETQAGKKYMSGNITGKMKLLIFKNEHKETDNHPDYIAYLAPHEKRQQPQTDEPQAPQPPTDDLPF